MSYLKNIAKKKKEFKAEQRRKDRILHAGKYDGCQMYDEAITSHSLTHVSSNSRPWRIWDIGLFLRHIYLVRYW